MSLFIVAHGNAFDGVTMSGPFYDAETATEWAERNNGDYGEWHIVPLDRPVELTPERELIEIGDMLSAWLTDNTDKVFEEEPEIDTARAMILERAEVTTG